jgi:hypothetical protein
MLPWGKHTAQRGQGHDQVTSRAVDLCRSQEFGASISENRLD